MKGYSSNEQFLNLKILKGDKGFMLKIDLFVEHSLYMVDYGKWDCIVTD